MIKKLKYILNSYTDEELEKMDLWVNSDEVIDTILVENDSVNLITSNSEIKINGFIEKEKENE